MIEAIIAKIIGSIFGFAGAALIIVVQILLWFFGTFLIGSVIWLIYSLTHRRKP